MLVAIRENEQRARFLGYPTNRYKLAAFVLSAGITGLAGILLLYQNRMTSADPISVSFSGDLLAMVVIGGMRSFLGPALGALFFILFREFLGIYTENWLFWFGLVFVGFIVFSPTGLIGVGERLIAPFRKKTTKMPRCRRAASNSCRCRNFCGRHLTSTDRCLPHATSSRALAASRPFRALISPSQTARCMR